MYRYHDLVLDSHSVLLSLMYFLDIFGTCVFAVTGSFKAIEHRYDIVGIIIVATVTGTAGGIMRDVLFGILLPNALTNPIYITVTIITGISVFFLYGKLNSQRKLFIIFDAIGLGVFTLTGGYSAYIHFGANLLVIMTAGVLTAVGGGILRDVLVNEHPIVFTKEIYAAASFLGIVTFYLLILAHVNFELNVTIATTMIIVFRLLSVKYNLNLPRVRSE